MELVGIPTLERARTHTHTHTPAGARPGTEAPCPALEHAAVAAAAVAAAACSTAADRAVREAPAVEPYWGPRRALPPFVRRRMPCVSSFAVVVSGYLAAPSAICT
jgi:hypothetical protein